MRHLCPLLEKGVSYWPGDQPLNRWAFELSLACSPTSTLPPTQPSCFVAALHLGRSIGLAVAFSTRHLLSVMVKGEDFRVDCRVDSGPAEHSHRRLTSKCARPFHVQSKNPVPADSLKPLAFGRCRLRATFLLRTRGILYPCRSRRRAFESSIARNLPHNLFATFINRHCV